MYCPNCGKGNPGGARICIHCGVDLSRYKVEISPEIAVSPIIKISVSAITKEQIDLLGKEMSKALKEAVSYKYILEKMPEFPPEERKAINILLEIGEAMESGRELFFSKYDPQDLEACVEFLNKWSRLMPEIKRRADYWMAKGVILLVLGKYDDALECSDRLMEISPETKWQWNSRGIILKNLKRYDEATHCFDRILDTNPENHLAWIGKADVISKQVTEMAEKFIAKLGNVTKTELDEDLATIDRLKKEGLRYVNKALDISSQYDEAWVLKYLFEEFKENRIQYIDKALEINPRCVSALFMKGVHNYLLAYKEQSKSKLQEAIVFFDKVLKIDPYHRGALREKEKLMKELRGLS